MLEIPANATSVSFLQGRWDAIEQSQIRAFGQDIDEFYDFDPSGAGTVQIKEKMTRQISTGRVQANMRVGILELRCYNVGCPSGLHYIDQTYFCHDDLQNQDAQRSSCFGKFFKNAPRSNATVHAGNGIFRHGFNRKHISINRKRIISHDCSKKLLKIPGALGQNF